VAQVVEYLPGKYEDLSPTSNTVRRTSAAEKKKISRAGDVVSDY
jgi:hypothetical protein